MEKLLREIYYNPETGYVSAPILYKRAKEKNDKVTLAQVNEWLGKQRVAQLHKPAKKVKSVGAIISRHLNQRWQADLIDMSSNPATLKRITMKWILVCVDVFSRKLWARALPTKEVSNVANAYQDIVNEVGVAPTNLDTDNGGEFGKTFDKSVDEVNHYRALVGDHRALGVVDSTIRTFKELVFKYITAEKNWAEDLQALVKNMNSRKRETLFNFSPNEVVKDQEVQALIATKNSLIREKMLEQKKDEPPFKEGDMVRIPAQQGKFKRGFKKQMTDKQYPITKVNAKSIEVDVDGKKRRFLFNEVLEGGVALTQDTYEVEKVLDETRIITRDRKKVKQFLVKFKGYDTPEWTDEGDIINN